MIRWPYLSMTFLYYLAIFLLLIILCRFISEARNRDPFTENFPDWKKGTWEMWTQFVRNYYSSYHLVNHINYLFIFLQIVIALTVHTVQTYQQSPRGTFCLKFQSMTNMAGPLFQVGATDLCKNVKM